MRRMRRKKMKMKKKKMMMMNKLALGQLFLFYKAFNPEVYNSVLLKKIIEM